MALFDGRTLVETSPHLDFMRGWTSAAAKAHAEEHGWEIVVSDALEIDSYERVDGVWRDSVGNKYEAS